MVRYDNTVLLLKLIAKRLASRLDCKQLNYEIQIKCTSDDKQVITMYPSVYVYPTYLNRKQSDRCTVLAYCIEKINKEYFSINYTSLPSDMIVISDRLLL